MPSREAPHEERPGAPAGRGRDDVGRHVREPGPFEKVRPRLRLVVPALHVERLRTLLRRLHLRRLGAVTTGQGRRVAGERVHTPGLQTDHGPDGIQAATATQPPPPEMNHSGIWLSRYEFFSSSRNETFEGRHYVVLLQHGSRLTGQSLPGASGNPDSPLSLDLTIDRNVVTGSWIEQTAIEGHYQGARHHGALQMLVEPTGRRMAGKWVGFGKDFDVNTGPWELRLMDTSTSKATLQQYSRAPEQQSR
ncbi:XRE family transcriptional regulator [Streptomyces sp. NPDC015661]|uniref:XRE family transcriptional regulator n=1 Tax=Streptomyces sp. NPDC015661 TaxID=3364961 RepID=UPI0036FE5B5F